MLDYFSNDKETVLKKNEKKKKLHELLDKYGNVEEIEKNAIGADGYEYMFANTNNLIDEVLEERRMGRLPLSVVREDIPQKRDPLLPEDDAFSLDGLTLSDKQKKAIKNLDMVNQLTVIKALREQQGIEKPHSKIENEIEKMVAENKHDNDLRIHDASKQYADESQKKQYASNEYAGVRSDAKEDNAKHKVVLDDDFYNRLALDESSHNYKAYNPQGGGFGAHGKYQMRKPILQDLGYVDRKGNFTGKDGINSIQDFYNNHDVQEKAVRDMMQINYGYLKKLNLLKYIGTKVSGVVNDKSSKKNCKKER